MITKLSLKEIQLLYIVVALQAEAQAYIDRYKLHKSSLGAYKLFASQDIQVIVSGMGVVNARNATQALINAYDITDDDIYLNVGICGAQNSVEIGTLLSFSALQYEGIEYKFKEDGELLTCVDEPLATPSCKFADMESYGFYDAVVHNPAIKHFHILKVVSDHFEPQIVTKEGAKKLLFNQIDSINSILFPRVTLAIMA